MQARARLLPSLLLLGALAPAASAAEEATADEKAVEASILASAGAKPYAVGAGDVLSVRVFGQSEFNSDYVVDEEGHLDLPWVGPVVVTGLGVGRITQQVKQILSEGFLKNPQVTVQIKTYRSQPVQLLGAVKKPDTYFLEGPTRLLDLLAMAGGVVNDKAGSEVRLTRQLDGRSQTLALDLDEVLSGGDGNFWVEKGDVINLLEGQTFYVNGEVGKPGDYAWKGGLTVTQALAMAGSSKTTANLRKVVLIRSSGEKLLINIARIVKGKDPDVGVGAGDQVIVSESAF